MAINECSGGRAEGYESFRAAESSTPREVRFFPRRLEDRGLGDLDWPPVTDMYLHQPKVPEPMGMSVRTARRVTSLVQDGIDAGVPWPDLRAAFPATVVSTEAIEATLGRGEESVDNIARTVDTHTIAVLERELTLCTSMGDDAVEATCTILRDAIDDYRARSTAVTVISDAGRGMTRTWWRPPTTEDTADTGAAHDRGHVRLVAVYGAQVGDGNRQMTIVLHEVADPQIDFDTLMGDSRVADSLAACAAAPHDPERRADAIAALTGVTDATPDWTEIYACPGTTAEGAGSNLLDGTVALVRSRRVQVGDHSYQENRIVHTVGPTVAAQALLSYHDVVEGLVDIAAAQGDREVMRRFGNAVEAALCANVADSSAAKSGYATVYRPPPARRTLTLTNAIGVSVGKRASSKAAFAQTAHIGPRGMRSASRAAATADRAGRRIAATGSAGTL